MRFFPKGGIIYGVNRCDMKEFIVECDDDLKNFTDDVYAQGSFWFRALLKKKDIRVNGKKTGENVPVKKGDKVAYYLTPKQESTPAFYEVYADENVLVVDKESGVNSEAVYAHFKSRGARFIHRLDRNTKGLLIFALTPQAEEELLRLFRERKIVKKYRAVVRGRLKKSEAVLTAYLKKDEKEAEVTVYDAPIKGAEKIVTEYKTLRTQGEFSLLEICLHTGKTHQIRAHFAHIGCPLVGDAKYGSAETNRELSLSRQCLVAKSLSVQSDGALAYLNNRTFFSRFDVELPTKTTKI